MKPVRASLPSPRLLVEDARDCPASPLGVALGTQSVAFNYLFIFPPGLCSPLRFQGSPDSPVRVFPGVWKPLFFKDSLPRMDLCPYLVCLSFYLLYFFLPPFEDNGLLFWVPDVFCWHSEVVLWNLLSVQMLF